MAYSAIEKIVVERDAFKQCANYMNKELKENMGAFRIRVFFYKLNRYNLTVQVKCNTVLSIFIAFGVRDQPKEA